MNTKPTMLAACLLASQPIRPLKVKPVWSVATCCDEQANSVNSIYLSLTASVARCRCRCSNALQQTQTSRTGTERYKQIEKRRGKKCNFLMPVGYCNRNTLTATIDNGWLVGWWAGWVSPDTCPTHSHGIESSKSVATTWSDNLFSKQLYSHTLEWY